MPEIIEEEQQQTDNREEQAQQVEAEQAQELETERNQATLLQQAAEKKKKDEEEQKRAAEEKKKNNPLAKATRKFLSMAWRNLFTLWGFLPGMAYINIHLFLHSVIPSAFEKMAADILPEKLRKTMGKMIDKFGGDLEKFTIGCLDTCCCFGCLGIIAMVMFTINIIVKILDFAK